MTEQWIRGRLLQRITFRDGLVLNLDDYNELVISAPLELTVPPIAGESGEVFTIDPLAVRREQKPLFDFAGATCTHADWDADGSLHLCFSSGQRIDVPSDDQHTSWELYGKYHGYAACLPRGHVRVVRHDLPEPEAAGA
ncbi:hypothetical protein RMCC_2885 [Mycolicibacterium canariasense]|uniref:Uncharacterized protein n=1 Tax=Mycolicibacterium canariasense TaxID=228230 RepID=A0A100WDE9_MYCCR|nr:DUF6188 family protein [Mycolicibacterium canariasense]MCV7210483.1 hypothetical protein [Mycolicibacterium canariasense]ORU97029.1 hypothetical protein AWB94_30230 [Mycolicibacterium canariasense]GAS95919.1 hypothetical protein RMCC_2885 [Mycolicibacterium canariasense]